MLHFTQYFRLNVTSHSQIDFVDIPLDGDVRLYLDPDRILADDSPAAKGAVASINSFFDELFNACRAEDYPLIHRLLACGREPNETHMGMSSGLSHGRGASDTILFPIFKDMINRGVFKQGLVTQASDVPILTPNFERDRMSDLITNVIRQDLFLFTIQQYAHWGIPIPNAEDTPYRGTYWDATELCWRRAQNWPALTAAGFPVLLIPKTFVCQEPLARPKLFFNKYVLEYRQKWHLDRESDLCNTKEGKDGEIIFLKPPKKRIRAVEMNGYAEKEYALWNAQKNPELLTNFHNDNRNYTRHRNCFLSDEMLDYIVYICTRKAE